MSWMPPTVEMPATCIWCLNKKKRKSCQKKYEDDECMKREETLLVIQYWGIMKVKNKMENFRDGVEEMLRATEYSRHLLT